MGDDVHLFRIFVLIYASSVYSSMLACDEVFSDVLNWIQRIILGSITIPSDNVFHFPAVAFTIYDTVNCVF